MTNIKNSLVDQIGDYGASVKAANDATALSAKLYTETDKSIRSLIERTLAEFSLEYNVVIRFNFNGRSPTGQMIFDPHFSLFHIIDCPPVRHLIDDKYFINVSGRWIRSKNTPSYNNTAQIRDLDLQAIVKHIDLHHLAYVCATLTEKTNCRVEYIQYTVMKENGQKILNSGKDLLAHHPGSCIVAHGHKNNDPWDVVRTRKGHLMVYYSTNGLGLGYDTVVQSNQSVCDFYLWLGDKAYRQMAIPSNILKKLDERGP